MAQLLGSLTHAERLFAPIEAAADALLGSRGCLLTFHRAAPMVECEDLPNRNFYLDLALLDRLLGYLKRTGWAVVTIEEAVRRAHGEKSDDRYVNFSVDDGYCDTFESVVPLFRRHNVPVTLFVTSGIPDGTAAMWWAGLEDVLSRRDQVVTERGTIDIRSVKAKRAAYSRIARDWELDKPERRYAAFCGLNKVDAQEVHRRHAISWDMLHALRHDPLVEIGAHSMTHARISSLSESDTLCEMVGSRERLQTQLGVPVRHFAFPFGRSGDCGPREFELARKAGFASAATTRKGLVRRDQDPFILPRNSLREGRIESIFGILANAEFHLTGMTGVAARIFGHV